MERMNPLMRTASTRTTERSLRRGALEKCKLFDELPMSMKDELAEQGRWVRMERRDRLYGVGAQAHELFILSRGRVRMTRMGNGDREITVDYRVAGEVVGEECLRTQTHRQDAKVLERLEALALPSGLVMRTLERHGAFASRWLAWSLQARADVDDRVEALLTRPVESRVAQFILKAAERHGVPDSRGVLIGAKFTHQEIASFVGSTRETVTLVLGDLKRRELVQIDHRRVVITNAEGLKAAV